MPESMPERYDAIVIGSGLGGLTAGALYARSGAKVLVLERNAAFGGAATTYHRGALTVEASLHETADPRAAPDPKSQVFEALDLYDDIELVAVEDIYEVRCGLIGEPFTLPHGFEAARARLVERFPAHAKAIRIFLRQIQRAQEAVGLIVGKHGVLDWIAHAPSLPLALWSILRDARSSLSDVLTRHFGDDEAIKFALAPHLSYHADDPDTFWWLAYAIVHGSFLQAGGAYIKGGSHALSDRLVASIREDGGEALAGQEAVAIELGPQGEARAVRYRAATGGTETLAEAPVIFANAAPHVIERMLPEERRDAFMAPYRDRPLSTSLFSLTLGLSTPPKDLGVTSYSTFLIPDWMTRLSDFKKCAGLLADMPGDKTPAIAVVDFSHIDSGLRKEGELYPVGIVGPDRLANWAGLSDEAYHARRDAWRDALIDRLDAEWPGFAAAVAETSMATARTMHEYLNTPEGAIYGFAKLPPGQAGGQGPTGSTATPIEGLWLASAFAGFGGFSGAIAAGSAAARAALSEREDVAARRGG